LYKRGANLGPGRRLEVKMSKVLAPSGSVAATWREIRRLYPIYVAMAGTFQLGDPPYKDLSDLKEQSNPEAVQRIERWLAEMDGRIQPHHLRQLVESGDLATSEDKLHTLIDRHLGRKERADADRDKLDFLLIQYFVTCAPPSFHDRDVDLSDVADVFETILREGHASPPKWLEPVEALIGVMQECETLDDLERRRIMERGRELKIALAEKYFDSISLVAFTRFNYLLRRTFFRLMNQELRAIESGLRELEARGVAFVDCTSAQLSSHEPIANLYQIHRNWKRPLIPDYAAGHSFDLLLRLRESIEHALAPTKNAPGDLQRRLDGIVAELDEMRCLLSKVLEHLELRPANRSTAPVLPAARPAAGRGVPPDPGTVTAAFVAPPAAPPASPVGRPSPWASPEAAPIPAVSSPPASPPDPGDCAKTPPIPSLAAGVERIKKLLSAKSYRTNAPVSIAVGSNQLMLIGGEVVPFIKDPDEAGLAIQRAVAARFVLIAASDWSKRTGQTPNLSPLLESAEKEAANLDRLIGENEKAKNITLVETLVHTRRQLLAITQQVAKASPR